MNKESFLPEEGGIFEKGALNPVMQYFSGTSYLSVLNDQGVDVYNVTFEPACRNNWHIHHAEEGGGQILLCTAGKGWYREWEKDPRPLSPGDVVYIPEGIKHWHGAARDSWFVHVAIEVPGKNAWNEWLEPVSDEEYNKIQEVI
ncbi:MAG: cupin domain-containing protein [Solobacterium sp.]|nr:cupin domain-containing protein [Solobacterium sp.]